MENKPISNETPENSHSPTINVNGDYIHVAGNSGPANAIGSGAAVNIHQLAMDSGTNYDNDSGVSDDLRMQFTDRLGELYKMIALAQTAGVLDNNLAKGLLEKVRDTADHVTGNKRPAKRKVLNGLQFVGDALDTVVDVVDPAGMFQKTVAKALPLVSLLIKIATRIF